MKKLNLKLGGIKEMLGKEQMRKVAGGYGDGGGNPNCGGDTSISDWYCCTGTGTGTYLPNRTCDEASKSCTSKLTNSLSLCN